MYQLSTPLLSPSIKRATYHKIVGVDPEPDRHSLGDVTMAQCTQSHVRSRGPILRRPTGTDPATAASETLRQAFIPSVIRDIRIKQSDLVPTEQATRDRDVPNEVLLSTRMLVALVTQPAGYCTSQ